MTRLQKFIDRYKPYPSTVIVDGVEYKINTDFQANYDIWLIAQEKKMNQRDLVDFMMEKMYFGNIPKDYEKAAFEAIAFRMCYDDIQRNPQISVDDDIKYIIPAMKKNGIRHNIEYYKKYHWWVYAKHWTTAKGSEYSRIRRLFDKWSNNNLDVDEQEETERYGWNKITLLSTWR